MAKRKKDDFDRALEHAIPQRSPQWYADRLGKVTASKCKKWMTRGRSKDQIFGEGSLSYLYGVLAEIITGHEHLAGAGAAPIAWGEEHEEAAVKAYSKLSGEKIEPAGFVLWDQNDLFGGSSDGRIKKIDWIIEAKCPYDPGNHARVAVSGELYNEDHYWQIQANILFSGAKGCRFISYDPRAISKRLQCVFVDVPRDEETISKIVARTAEIDQWLRPKIDKLKRLNNDSRSSNEN